MKKSCFSANCFTICKMEERAGPGLRETVEDLRRENESLRAEITKLRKAMFCRCVNFDYSWIASEGGSHSFDFGGLKCKINLGSATPAKHVTVSLELLEESVNDLNDLQTIGWMIN